MTPTEPTRAGPPTLEQCVAALTIAADRLVEHVARELRRLDDLIDAQEREIDRLRRKLMDES